MKNLFFILFTPLLLTTCGIIDPFSPTKSIKIECVKKNGDSIDIEKAKEVLFKRLDGLSYNYEIKNTEKDRFEVLLDNEADIGKVISQITSSGNIEFWDTFKNIDVGNGIYEFANDYLSNKLYPGYKDSVDIALKNKLEEEKEVKELKKESNEDTTVYLTDEEFEELTSELVSDNERLDPNYRTTVDLESGAENKLKTFRKTSPLSAYLYPYADVNSQWVESPVLGYAKLEDTAIINSYINDYNLLDSLPYSNLMLMWESISSASTQDGTPLLNLYLVKNTRSNSPELDGYDVLSSEKSIDPLIRKPIVTIQFSKTGAIVWGDMTERSARNQTGIAITIDNKVFSAPIASSRIEGGNTQVTGGAFNGAEGVFEADRVSSLLNNGKSGYRFIVIDVKDIKNDK